MTYRRKQQRKKAQEADKAQAPAEETNDPNQQLHQVGNVSLSINQAYANVVAIGRAHVCNADQRDLINSSIELLRLRCLRAAELEAELAELGETKMPEQEAPVEKEKPVPAPVVSLEGKRTRR